MNIKIDHLEFSFVILPLIVRKGQRIWESVLNDRNVTVKKVLLKFHILSVVIMNYAFHRLRA